MPSSTTPKARRGFSSGFPELDALYRKVYAAILASPWHHPFRYAFLPDGQAEGVDSPPPGVPGTHRLTIGDQYRFEKHTWSARIETRQRLSSGWSDVEPGLEAEAFAPSVYDARSRPRTLDRVSPVFWPIAQATPQDAMFQITRVRKALWEASVMGMEESHPHLFVRKTSPPSPQLPNGRLHASPSDRALMVMSRQQDRTYARLSKGNYRAAIRWWWEHFVDRALFSSLVSVVGGSNAVVVDFAAYAAFTRHPDLDNIVKTLPELGEARRLLACVPWSRWNASGIDECLGGIWTSTLRGRFEALPRPMRLALAPSMHCFDELEQFDLSSWMSLLEKVATARLLPRQQAMATRYLLDLAIQAHKGPLDDDDAFFSLVCGALGRTTGKDILASRRDRARSVLSRPDLIDRLVDTLAIWRLAFPDRYLRYASSDRSAFLADAKMLLEQSPSGRVGMDLSPNDSTGFQPALSDHQKVLAAAILKYNIEKILPRRGRGRPRKTELPTLSSTGNRPRPAM